MSNQTKDGGPAFPSAYPAPTSTAQLGMSLRDWFAGMALQGYLANGDHVEISKEGVGASKIIKLLSRAAYGAADAMLKQREL